MCFKFFELNTVKLVSGTWPGCGNVKGESKSILITRNKYRRFCGGGDGAFVMRRILSVLFSA